MQSLEFRQQQEGAMPKRLKILISAYACNPTEGSEPYVGWSLAREVANYHEVWLLTRANNRTAIEADLARRPEPSLHVVYFDLPRWARFWKKGPRRVQLYYYLWQVYAYWIGKRLHREVSFDIVHHLTFGNDWVPSFLAFLPVPFVWGPIVGARSASKVFRQSFAWKARMQEHARVWVRRLSRVDPLQRWAAHRAALGVAATAEARAHLLRLGFKNVAVFPSVGVSLPDVQSLPNGHLPNRNGQVRFLCVGRLLAFKAYSSTLRAFAEARQRFPQAELWIMGDGPERASLRRLAEQLGLEDGVKFWGWLPREEMLSRLSECDALVYLCLRGAVSMACLEAMAARLPVICLDLGGPAVQVTDQTGIKIPAVSPEQVVRDLAEAMGRLAEDSGLRRRLGEAARQRVQDEFSWEAKGKRMCKLYLEALAAKPVPELGEISWREVR
jgi:glycosyltransferase involved in cell wall biosynthesis